MELIRVPKVENVKLVDRLYFASPDVGTLYLTPTHVIFVTPNSKKEYWILLTLVSSVEKQPTTVNGCPLFLKCKNFLHVTFLIPKEKDAIDVYLSLNQLSQPSKINDLYCFFYNSQDEFVEKTDGWSNFDLRTEYKRVIGLCNAWIESDINKNYSICSTYPSILHVPKLAHEECLIESAKFRSKGRLPVLSYLYLNEAAICRCAQPLSGFNNRSMEDELLLEYIRQANPSSKLHIVDTRPKINAMANRAAGKGYENEQFYLNAKFHFLAIENIHVMRASLNKLLEACDVKLTVGSYLSSIEASHWLKHVKSLLETSDFIACSVRDGISVLVHCSDGWDRTAQACSLSAIQLDPFYRSIKGFQELIHKEWLSFGYKFSDRCGHTLSDLRETAPVFTQFLDAVWQMLNQYPSEFEFTEDFLILIHDHIYSCQFGTFVGNCERERVELELSSRTYSFWAFVDVHRDEYVNPLYQPIGCTNKTCIYDLTGTISNSLFSGAKQKSVDVNDETTIAATIKTRDSLGTSGNDLLCSNPAPAAATMPHKETRNNTQVGNVENQIVGQDQDQDQSQSQSQSKSPTSQPATVSASRRSLLWQAAAKTSTNASDERFALRPPVRSAANFLKLDSRAQRVKFWRSLYNRHELLVHPRESPVKMLAADKAEAKLLESQVKLLESRAVNC